MEEKLIKNARLVNDNQIIQGDILIRGERILKIGADISSDTAEVIDVAGSFVIPGIN